MTEVSLTVANPWASFPKVELHVHLDCSLSFRSARHLAPGLDERRFHAELVAPARCADLRDFLRVAERSVALLQTEDALRVATADVVEQLATDGVIYAEIRFAPLLHIQSGLTPTRVA